jgi:hypothetical protein
LAARSEAQTRAGALAMNVGNINPGVCCGACPFVCPCPVCRHAQSGMQCSPCHTQFKDVESEEHSLEGTELPMSEGSRKRKEIGPASEPVGLAFNRKQMVPMLAGRNASSLG